LLEYTTDSDPQFTVILERIKRNIDNIRYLPDFVNKLALAVLKYRMKELLDGSKTEHFEYILDLLAPELKKNRELEEKGFIQEVNYIREYLFQDLKSSIVHFLYLIKDIHESSEYDSLDPIIRK